jgi:hypothetical protein
MMRASLKNSSPYKFFNLSQLKESEALLQQKRNSLKPTPTPVKMTPLAPGAGAAAARRSVRDRNPGIPRAARTDHRRKGTNLNSQEDPTETAETVAPPWCVGTLSPPPPSSPLLMKLRAPQPLTSSYLHLAPRSATGGGRAPATTTMGPRPTTPAAVAAVGGTAAAAGGRRTRTTTWAAGRCTRTG